MGQALCSFWQRSGYLYFPSSGVEERGPARWSDPSPATKFSYGQTGLGMWVLFFFFFAYWAYFCAWHPSLWLYVSSPHPFTSLKQLHSTHCHVSLLRAFQADGTGPGQMGSPGNSAGACAFSPACDFDMLCIHLQIRTVAQSHQPSQVTGRTSNSRVRLASSSSVHSSGASGMLSIHNMAQDRWVTSEHLSRTC